MAMIGEGIAGLLSRASTFATQVKARIEGRRQQHSGYQPTGDEQFALSKLDEAKRTRLATLEALEPQWTRQILYCAGIQHLRFLSTQQSYEPVKAEDWMPLPSINYIQAKVQRAVNFFTGSKPVGHVLAPSEHEDDKEAAEYARQVVDHLNQINGDQDKLDEAATWLVTTGNCFWKTFADASGVAVPEPQMNIQTEPLMDDQTGGPAVDPETGLPVMTSRYQEVLDEAGLPVEQKTSPSIRTEVYGPLHMVVPLAAPRLDVHSAPWCMEVSMQPLEKLRQMYPHMAQHIGESARVVTSDLYHHRVLSLVTTGLHGVVRAVDPYTLDGFGIVYHYEAAPSVEFSNGLLVVAFDDMPLVVDELPLGDRYSWEHCGYYRVPGRFWYRGLVEDCIDPQDQINKLEQFLRVNDDHNSNPTWLKPTQAHIPEGKTSNKPGIEIEYTFPFKPEVIQGVSLSPQIVQRRAMYTVDMEKITGMEQVLTGSPPSGVRAGVALARLREQAEAMFEAISKRWDTFIERKTEAALRAVSLYWTEAKHFSVAGDDGSVVEVRDFVGSMLRGVNRFRIEAGSWRPKSVAGQQQIGIDVAGMGLLPELLTNPDHHRRFLDLMGLEGFESEQSLDYRRAKLENEMLSRPVGWEQVQREPGDNDLVHLQTHTEARKRPEWARLPNVTKKRWLMHEIEHTEAIMLADGIPDITESGQDPATLKGMGQQPGASGGPQGPGGPPQGNPSDPARGPQQGDQNGPS